MLVPGKRDLGEADQDQNDGLGYDMLPSALIESTDAQSWLLCGAGHARISVLVLAPRTAVFVTKETYHHRNGRRSDGCAGEARCDPNLPVLQRRGVCNG